MCDLSEYADKNLKEMLEFESQLFLDILHQDALVVTAKGLHIDVIFTNLLKVYCDPGNLVIIINCPEYDEKYYISQLNDENVHTAAISVTEREDNYLKGGIHFISTRMLVVDLLKKRIPIEKITGIFVLQAHTVLESCQEAFCLRLYRQHNKTGFIKGFSNNAEAFTIGFGHVERIMRAIFVKELFIWPRFHVLVQQSLKKYEPTVIELHVPISQTMKNIQACILDLINVSVAELKRINKTIDMQEITVENCVAKNFHKILQAQLDCVWFQLNGKTRQLIADLKTLRYLIITMLYSDAITFYTIINQYRRMEYAQNSTWILHKSADQLFALADNLVFTGDKELNPEYSPKWNILSEILQTEIPMDITKEKSVTKPKILVLCHDTKTCFQLNQYLSEGPQKYLFLMAMKKEVKFKKLSKKFLKNTNAANFIREFNETKLEESFDKPKKSKRDSKKEKEPPTDLNSLLEEKLFADLEDDFENAKSFFVLTMSQYVDKSKIVEENEDESAEEEEVKPSQKKKKEKDVNESCYAFEPFAEMDNLDLSNIENDKNEPVIMIQTFKIDGNLLSLPKTLEEFQPNYIIMYHSNVAAIRQIELYEARRRKETPLKVYFLIHAETVEEQSYLTELRREKQAFELLIETKSKMVVPDYQDGKSDDCLAVQRTALTPTKNTRQGGKQEETPERKLVIVDMREFRSDLPALIHKRGIDIEPVTITIGDYILTPEICVERKSISDLIGSLNSGRLYQQCTQMSRHYTKPMLLIEFDQSRSFKFQGSYMLSNDSSNSSTFDIQKKLQLLTIHFPKLKIVWSPSPYASAQLFEELKEGKDQPSAEYAASLGADLDLDLIDRKYNSSIYDFIQKCPGINSKNIDTFLRNSKNLNNVIKMSEEELKEILGNSSDAKSFYSFLHDKHFQPEIEQDKKKSKTRQKFKFNKK